MRVYRDLPSGTLTRARTLRRNATDAERLLWKALREKLPYAKFRRQVPIGRYVADFVCFEAKLIVELDGSQHADSRYDRVRDAALSDRGFEVLRIWNGDLFLHRDGVLTLIWHALTTRTGIDHALS